MKKTRGQKPRDTVPLIQIFKTSVALFGLSGQDPTPPKKLLDLRGFMEFHSVQISRNTTENDIMMLVFMILHTYK
jgi:hypothetical protein